MRWVWMFLLAGLVACSKEAAPEAPDSYAWLQVPDGFPPPPAPADNPLTEASWILGKRLFYDPVLSRDSTVSCASCHLAGQAFSDTLAFSRGVDGRIGTRNAPTLANVAYHPYFNLDGGVPTLEMQVAVPVQEAHELDFNMVAIAQRLHQDSTYRALSQAAYQRDPDPFVLTRALATFERSLISGNSHYDRHLRGQEPLSAAAERGRGLFFSERTGCAHCHSGFNFTHYAFENNGLLPGTGDPGRARVTGRPEDLGRFKVPTLRNIAQTAPYMHDGRFASLQAVLEHYNRGGEQHASQHPLIRPLGLSPAEIQDLLTFLHSLTDTEFLNNTRFKP